MRPIQSQWQNGPVELGMRSFSEPSRFSDDVTRQIDEYTRGKHVMVYSGFSELGYSDPSKLEETVREQLDQAIVSYGSEKVCVAAGATSDGIGMVYAVAAEMGVDTIGVVSVEAQRNPESISKHCNKVIYVDDPKGTWEVVNARNESYMVYLARNMEEFGKTGEFLALGGGRVALKELEEAKSLRIPAMVMPHFEPDPDKAKARLEKAPGQDLTPVRTHLGIENKRFSY
ncbi:hypothetical protein [Ralstonia mojiangensis]|uniref:hypothetical protein n=1 Tax=Ralstonia mojiangensis TaxID=2953895 RepID=UPI0020915427|nr:hypothetical protein [Ralstonia mojiangensis]MCO5413487.1 hypothetical protein [Ralstonia mojiangensis]